MEIMLIALGIIWIGCAVLLMALPDKVERDDLFSLGLFAAAWAVAAYMEWCR